MVHLILCRLGLGCRNNDWFDRALALFEAVTLSSLIAQTNQDFHFIVLVDKSANLASRILPLIADHKNFHLVEADLSSQEMAQMGGHNWMYRACHDYIFGHLLIEDPSEYIITSTIDADDALNTTFVARVNETAAERVADLKRKEAGRGSHLSHSAGLGITFENGLVYYATSDRYKRRTLAFSSLSVSIVARASTGISAWSCRHLAWPHMLEILSFDTLRLENSVPMWLYVRHPWAVTASDANDADVIGPDLDLKSLFGVDVEKLHGFLNRFDLGDDRQLFSGGMFVGDQFSRIYQMMGLTTQISAIEKRLSCETLPVNERQRLCDLLSKQRNRLRETNREFQVVGLEKYGGAINRDLPPRSYTSDPDF